MHVKPIKSLMDSNINCVSTFGNYLAYLWQYRAMLYTMVEKNLKGRFKYTTIGYGWHLLNPLFQITVYLLIFTVIFGRDIPNYWVYVSTGMFAFTFFSSCIVSGCKTIIDNSKLVTKMAFAREILVISKVLTNLFTLVVSYSLLTVLIILSGAEITWNILYLPLILFFFTIMTLGCVFLLSALTVYLRDLANAVSIIMGCMMFALPLMYLVSQRTTPLMNFIWSINPLYYFVECIHNTFYWGTPPDPWYITVCAISALIIFVIGLFIFKKLERGFAERL